MAARESKIVDLIPNEGDGVTTNFNTPDPFKAGSIRVFINGLEYPADDDLYGWAELANNEIQFNGLAGAPKLGDEIAAFYQEEDPVTGTDIDGVVGSPFPPGGCCP
jgi:hypothetical protein